MTIDPALLLRYLRQRRELGESEWLLDELDAREVVRALKDAAAGRTPKPTSPGAHAAPAEATRAAPAEAHALPAAGAAPGELALLRDEALACTKCRLAETRRTVVFGEGAADADVVVVGEAPGGEEDRTGRPFVGPAGKLLDLLLMSAGFPRERVFICNVLKCRPPNNRDPLADEVASCTPYLRRQIELIRPRVLLAVGKFAARVLLDSEESMGRLRGQVRPYRGVPVVATYHPAFLLRSPHWVRAAWEDFQLLRRVHDEQA